MYMTYNRITIIVPERLNQQIVDSIESGQFATKSDVVRCALRQFFKSGELHAS